MGWVRADDQFDDDPDIDTMSTDAIALFWCANTWSSRNRTDGFIPKERARKLPGGTAKGLKDLLKGESPWWVPVEGGYQIRNYLKFNLSAKEQDERKQEISEARSRAGANGAAKRWGKHNTKDDSKQEILPYQTDSKQDSKPPDLLIANDGKSIAPIPNTQLEITRGIRESSGRAPESIDEVRVFMENAGIPRAEEEAAKFFGHYGAAGWMIGDAPIRNWKLLVGKWNVNRHKFDEPRGSPGSRQPKTNTQQARDTLTEIYGSKPN